MQLWQIIAAVDQAGGFSQYAFERRVGGNGSGHHFVGGKLANQLALGNRRDFYSVHHGTGIIIVDIGGAAISDCQTASLYVVAESDEGAFKFTVIGIAGNPHFDGELSDTDEVL